MGLTVTHSFVSAKADSTDPTVVNPSNWNANHTVADNSAVRNSIDYLFTPIAPGGSLVIGANTITLPHVPYGVNGTDANHQLYISGGTGTAEAVPIIGGTAVGGGTNQTIIVTCANTHSGAWTISSVLFGVPEAIASLPAAGGRVDGTGSTGAQTAFGLTTIPTKVSVLLGAVTITGLTTGPTIRLGGNGSQLRGLGPGITTIQANIATQQIVLVANTSASVFSQDHLVADLSILLTNTNGSANGLDIYAAWYSVFRNVTVKSSGGTVNGAGIELRDVTFNATEQGAYGNTFDHCLVGMDALATGFAKGIWFNSTSASFGITVINVIGCWAAYNGVGLTIGGTSSVRWVLILGGAYDYNSSHGINLVYSDQVWIHGSDIEGNGGWGITGTVHATEVDIRATFANNVSGNVNAGLAASGLSGLAKLWDFSDHGGTNRGDINFFGSTPRIVFQSNGFTVQLPVGVDYDGSTLILANNLRPINATTANLIDVSVGGSLLRINATGAVLLTCTAGANPRTFTQQWSNNAGAEVGQSRNYFAAAGGSANTILATLTGTTLASGLRVTIKLNQTLQIGANTFNGVAIKSSRNPANNIGVGYAATGSIDLLYDSTGPYYLDMSQ